MVYDEIPALTVTNSHQKGINELGFKQNYLEAQVQIKSGKLTLQILSQGTN